MITNRLFFLFVIASTLASCCTRPPTKVMSLQDAIVCAVRSINNAHDDLNLHHDRKVGLYTDNVSIELDITTVNEKDVDGKVGFTAPGGATLGVDLTNKQTDTNGNKIIITLKNVADLSDPKNGNAPKKKDPGGKNGGQRTPGLGGLTIPPDQVFLNGEKASTKQ